MSCPESSHLLVDDIEMTGLSDIEEKPPPQPPAASIVIHDSDDDDDDDDDSSQALLASYGRGLDTRELLGCAGHLWPQIRGIVTEVIRRRNTLFGAKLTNLT